MESTTDLVGRVLMNVQIMREEILDGHDRSAHLYADIQAYISQVLTELPGDALGDLLLRLRWQVPDVVEWPIIARALHITPQQARELVEERAA